MFSYFGDSKTPNPDLEQASPAHQTSEEPMPEGLAAIDASEKATLMANIDANVYTRRNGDWRFRRDFAP